MRLAAEDRPAEGSTTLAGAGDPGPAIAFREVGHDFTGPGGVPVPALTDIDLEIPDGQFVAFVGASGCGKTTLLNMVAGLVAPSSGTVSLRGRAPHCPTDEVGYMYARDALLPWRTARDNVELGLVARKVPRARRREVAAEMLRLVGLADRAAQYPLQLSQGMRQRVALARTLAINPRVVLMDEPFAALDARTKLDMQVEFLRIWERDADSGSPRTVVFVTHDLQEATLLADRVVVMLPSPGRIALDRVIDLPRPRAEAIRTLMFQPEFREIEHELFTSLEGAIPGRAS